MSDPGIHDRLREIVGNTPLDQLAELSDVHPETVRRYLNGKSTPSVLFVIAVCERFNVNSQWLLTGDGAPRDGEQTKRAVKKASSEDLLNAIADALERLTNRVEQMEAALAELEDRVYRRDE